MTVSCIVPPQPRTILSFPSTFYCLSPNLWLNRRMLNAISGHLRSRCEASTSTTKTTFGTIKNYFIAYGALVCIMYKYINTNYSKAEDLSNVRSDYLHHQGECNGCVESWEFVYLDSTISRAEQSIKDKQTEKRK